jgi:hypothetical protein
MSERRYSDEEVRRILALAAEAEAAAEAESERAWTLPEVARIGVEAGIAPEAVASAALALERQHAMPEERHLFGLPVSVSRAVPLGRHLTDDDWERLVGELRDTFAARGQLRVSGARREWRVGNLRVTHEPLGSGALLELRTRKGDARAFLQLGVLLLVMAAVVAGLTAAGLTTPRGNTAPLVTLSWLGAFAGVLMLIVGALRLPAWARRRARQFEALAAYARRIAST